MKRVLCLSLFIMLLGGCWPFGGKKALPDKRSQVPGSTEVNNYLEEATTAESVHCITEEDNRAPAEKTYFHDGHAKIATNHVGRDVSHSWDDSWNTMIDETLEQKFPELISEDINLDEGELIQLGCGGFSVASKKDKKRFWALFLASLARVQSGFDPSFQEGNQSGLFALDPAKMGPLGGECEGKDKWDFMEPSYSFGCVFEGLKEHMRGTKRLFSSTDKTLVPFPVLTGASRFEFIKFFKAHAASQFSFCTSGVDAPEELVSANTVGESQTAKCSPSEQARVRESLDRSEVKVESANGTGDGTSGLPVDGSVGSGESGGTGSDIPTESTGMPK